MLSRTLLSLHEIAWQRAVTSHANVLYYQKKVALWTNIDTGVRIASAIAASSAVALFLSKTLPGLALTISVLAALGNIVGITMRVPDKVRALGVLLAEYTAHANAFEMLHQFDPSEADVRAALQAFSETEQREAKDHPNPSTKLLAKCQDAVHARIGTAA